MAESKKSLTLGDIIMDSNEQFLALGGLFALILEVSRKVDIKVKGNSFSVISQIVVEDSIKTYRASGNIAHCFSQIIEKVVKDGTFDWARKNK